MTRAVTPATRPSSPAWLCTPAAWPIFHAIRPADVTVGIHRNVVGPDEWVWRCDALDRLEAARRRWIDAATGIDILTVLGSTDRPQDYDEAKCLEWYDFERSVPSVQDALCERFGNPVGLFGSVPGILGDAVEANARWRAMADAIPGEARAA